jgi:hypothetical protein
MARRIAEGRGIGRGSAYRPWLRVQDVPSCGNASRIRSPITGREHHLMSDLERNWFLIAHADPRVCDCREQFPLLPLEETLAIARAVGIDHPTEPTTGKAIVMTTDLVISLAGGLREFDFARAVKPAEQLSSPRVLEKLEVERRFWRSRDVDWAILTERELPAALLRNMRWLFPCIQLPRFSDFSAEHVARARAVMEPAIIEGRQSLLAMATECDSKLGLKAGTGLLLARHLIASRQWVVDLSHPIDVRRPLNLRPLDIIHDFVREHAA